MPTEVADLEARLHACETDLEAHRGYLKAQEYCLRTLIVSHPQPAALASLWAQLLPAIAQAHIGSGSSAFTSAFQQALVLLGDQIQDSIGR